VNLINLISTGRDWAKETQTPPAPLLYRPQVPSRASEQAFSPGCDLEKGKFQRQTEPFSPKTA